MPTSSVFELHVTLYFVEARCARNFLGFAPHHHARRISERGVQGKLLRGANASPNSIQRILGLSIQNSVEPSPCGHKERFPYFTSNNEWGQAASQHSVFFQATACHVTGTTDACENCPVEDVI